jgi:methionyl-tRNA synthetase
MLCDQMMRLGSIPTILSSPYIPLQIALRDGIEILQSTGCNVIEETEPDHLFMVKAPTFGMAIYAKGNKVGSVWYDDPIGRATSIGKEKKIELYLLRYGSLSNWELRMENGWMRYWFNPLDKAAMVYGIHKDVIRFNQYNENAA